MNITSLRKDELENELIKYVNSYFINLQKWQRVNNIINMMITTKNPHFIHKHIKDDLHWIFGIDFYVVYLRKNTQINTIMFITHMIIIKHIKTIFMILYSRIKITYLMIIVTLFMKIF